MNPDPAIQKRERETRIDRYISHDRPIYAKINIPNSNLYNTKGKKLLFLSHFTSIFIAINAKDNKQRDG